MPRKARYLLLIFLPLALLLATGYLYLNQQAERRLLIEIRAAERLATGLGVDAVTRHLDTVFRDLRYLASLEALGEAVSERAAGAKVREALTRQFARFSEAARIYDQIRWIDETGMERVRVDFSQAKGASFVVPQAMLQNKASRYYFGDAMALKPGGIYVSPLDLNVEGGVVETPYKPMLRVATPVADAAGRPRGIVILNYLARQMLDEFGGVIREFPGDMMLLNSEGFWLKSINPEDEWGFMFRRAHTLGSMHPIAWAQIRGSLEGQIERPSGVWTWRTIYPLHPEYRSSTGTAEVAGPSRDDVSQTQYRWKVVSRVAPERAAKLTAKAGMTGEIVLLLALALAGLLSWGLATALDGRARAREDLERLAATDPLTGLANRRAFTEQLRHYWGLRRRNAQLQIGALMMDLDFSRRSTTATAMPRGMRYCATSPNWCGGPCAKPTAPAASAARNSRRCCPRPMRPVCARLPNACARSLNRRR